MPRSRWRELSLNLVLSLATVLAVLAVAELALRWREAGSPTRRTSLADYTEYDPLLGWRKRANVRLQFVRGEYQVPFETNSRGLRDPERDLLATPGAERILALGDSYVEGYTVALDQTVTQRLEAALRRDGCRPEVINGATTGYSTDQEYLFYASEGVKYAPGTVLLFFYQNDVYQNDSALFYEGVPKPFFMLRSGELRLWKQPVPRPASRAPAPEEAQSDESPLRTVEWLKSRLWFGAPLLYNRLGALGLWEANRPVGARLEQRVFSREVIPQLEGGWQKTEAILGKLAREVRSAGQRLLLVYVPARFEFNDRAWALTAQKYAMKEGGWDRGLVRERLAAIAQRQETPLLDLTAAMGAADRGALGGPYFERDGHWNALGHETAAREVAAWLRSAQWLPGCLPARTSEPGLSAR